MLEASELTLWRGPRCLFEQLSFRITRGNALLVRGANGAGKTTLLRVICRLTRPESGQILWEGAAIGPDFAAHLAYNGHLPGLKMDLTVRQNLTFFARAGGRDSGSWRGRATELGLEPIADLVVRHLSAGQRRRTALVRLLMSDALVWILDEPFTNLDRQGRDLVECELNAHLDRGGLAVVAAHDSLQIPTARLASITLGRETMA